MWDRECGNCNVCCIIGAVPELNKPVYTPCKYLKDCDKGCCSIFESPDLPDTCKNYKCGWLQGAGQKNDRPIDNNVMFTCNLIENQVYWTAFETEDNAIRTTGADMAVQIALSQLTPIIVMENGKGWHSSGEWVIVANYILDRAKNIVGEEVHRYDDRVAMYELIKGK